MIMMTNYASSFLMLMPILPMLLILLLSSVDFSYGWVTPSSSSSSSSISTSSGSSSISSISGSGGSHSHSHGSTAKFFKSSTVLTEDSSAAQSIFPGVKDPPSSSTTIESITTTETSLSTISKLPWMTEGDNSNSNNNNNSNNVYLSHWNWQLSYFQEHLTNLRVNDNKDKDISDDINDLYYLTDGGDNDDNDDNDDDDDDDKPQQQQNQKQKRVYTISLESDEYRDIRMTYMHFPGAQCFRCLSYPRNGDLPIMGMGLMKFGGNGGGGSGGGNTVTTKTTSSTTASTTSTTSNKSATTASNNTTSNASAAKNMAFMDYQPLPAANNNMEDDDDDDDDSHKNKERIAINDLYTSELVRLRSQIPSMSQPMSHRHFDSKEERKYFTEVPLIGRWSDDDDDGNDGNDDDDDDDDISSNSAEQHRIDLERAQHEYVQTHIQLTQQFGEFELCNKEQQQQQQHVLKLHSDFDTHVSEKEPAGRFLCSAFGAEVGNKLVHNIIFPLSRGGQQQQQQSNE